jgi:hypothetical protein
MSVKDKSLTLLTPMYGGMLAANFHNSVRELEHAFVHHGVRYSILNVYNESLIPRARNRLVDAYLKETEATHAAFIDADIGFEWQDVMAMLEMDLDVVGAGCVKKFLRWDRVQEAIRKNGREYTPDELQRIAGDYVVNFDPGKEKQGFTIGEPVEVATVGTGLMMIRRNVFEKYMEAYPDRWYDMRGGDTGDLPGQIFDFFGCGIDFETHHYDSEDYRFCKDVRKIGMKVWMCPWMRTTHMGTYKFIGDLPAVSALVGKM